MSSACTPLMTRSPSRVIATLPSAVGVTTLLSLSHEMADGGVLSGGGQRSTTWSNTRTFIVPEVAPWMEAISVHSNKRIRI